MQVILDKQYPIAAPLDAAWSVMTDIRELATCMPGAQITEQLSDNEYKGSVKVKVGPATAAFSGDIEVLGVDADTRTLRMMGKGADKGGSTASMELTATLVAAEDGSTTLQGKADVIVNGKFAQFGGRMLNSVSDVLLAQFAANYSNKAQALASVEAAPAGEAGMQGDTSAGECAAQAQQESAARHAAPPPPKELNALALVWAMIRNFFAGLFGRRQG
jgi:carbon monoxide dehydrogenase subunit G